MRIYVTGYWEDDQSLLNTIKKYAFGKTTWKNLEFTTEPGFDKVVVLNHCNSNSLHFSADKAVYFRLEPPASSNYLHDSDSYIVPGFMHWPLLHKFPKEKLYKIYKTGHIKKSRLFSTVTSDLAYMDGHVERLIMIHLLDRSISKGFDVWGRKTTDSYFETISAYRGELYNKYEGMLDYAYHLSVENSFINDYFTEKISDPILSECLCFYAGCSNIEEYIDSRAFCKIDLTNKGEARETIIRAIQDDHRKKTLKYIKQQKKRLLTDLNPLNLIWLAVNERDYVKEIKL
ncbi:glycosyltransferase family 10 domain-containing protein [Pedobacter panaciterrae]|uniref:glycosyltransferase family 10 domain-containing protein n=1 Tax=Pedobacter panaciterrae TaxID=363849 RepID=UPI002599E5DB|nr:glycosyltransferase family 10 [uncultured Pedobacter sp.]